MTTNHRPTLESKRGKVNSITDTISHSRALPQQTTLKYREDGSKLEHKKGKRALEELRTELLIREGRLPEPSERLHLSKRAKLKENPDNLDLKETQEDNNNDTGSDYVNDEYDENSDDNEEDGIVSNESESSGSESDNEGDSEDETELLLAELAKIRQERQEKKEKVEKQAKIDRALSSNPLVFVNNENEDKTEEVPKKRSWRSRTAFSNRPSEEISEQDDYTNDTLRSKHHQKFLNKFVR